MDKNVNERNTKTDIILELKPLAGGAKSSKGLTDGRLFTGENKLHAKMDIQTCLWHCELEAGVIPPELKQQFTSFSKLLKHTRNYYLSRNVEISNIID